MSLIIALAAGQNFFVMRSMLPNLAMVGIFLCGEALDDEFADFFFDEFLWSHDVICTKAT